MKYFISLFFLIFIGKTFAQVGSNIGIINDADGYTNIRKEASTKSQIVGKILQNEYFFYEEYNSNWCKITTQNKVKGFVHKSRIKNIDENQVICLKISFEDNSEERINRTARDTILSVFSLKDSDFPFFIIGFNYTQIESKERKESYVLFGNETSSVKFSIRNVNTKDYKIRKDKYGNNKIITTEKNRKVYGFLGDRQFPKKEIDNIQISINRGNTYNLPKSVYKYLFEPTLESVKVYIKGRNQLIIYMSGAEASEGYEVIFIVNEKQLLKRYIYRNF